VLVIHGTEDEFTSEAKYNRWTDALRAGAQAQLDIITVEEGTHFWNGEARTRLHEAVFEWLDRP
jgi:alpha/beta superfamily hydrolase